MNEISVFNANVSSANVESVPQAPVRITNPQKKVQLSILIFTLLILVILSALILVLFLPQDKEENPETIVSPTSTITYKVCSTSPNSAGCISCKKDGITAEKCSLCENSQTEAEYLATCVYPIREYREYTYPGVFIDDEFMEMTPFEFVIEDNVYSEYIYSGYYHEDMATVTPTDEGSGISMRYTIDNYYIDIVASFRQFSTINGDQIYYSYNSDNISDVSTNYLGKLYRVESSGKYIYTDSYLTDECQTISDRGNPENYLTSPCGNGLINSFEVNDSAEASISGLQISCTATDGQTTIDHTSNSANICFEIIKNLRFEQKTFKSPEGYIY